MCCDSEGTDLSTFSLLTPSQRGALAELIPGVMGMLSKLKLGEGYQPGAYQPISFPELTGEHIVKKNGDEGDGDGGEGTPYDPQKKIRKDQLVDPNIDALLSPGTPSAPQLPQRTPASASALSQILGMNTPKQITAQFSGNPGPIQTLTQPFTKPFREGMTGNYPARKTSPIDALLSPGTPSAPQLPQRTPEMLEMIRRKSTQPQIGRPVSGGKGGTAPGQGGAISGQADVSIPEQEQVFKPVTMPGVVPGTIAPPGPITPPITEPITTPTDAVLADTGEYESPWVNPFMEVYETTKTGAMKNLEEMQKDMAERFAHRGGYFGGQHALAQSKLAERTGTALDQLLAKTSLGASEREYQDWLRARQETMSPLNMILNLLGVGGNVPVVTEPQANPLNYFLSAIGGAIPGL